MSRGYGQHETQQLLRPSLLRPEELSMESGIDPGQDYYTQDYYNYDHGYDLPQYGSRRKLISPSGLYDEYGEVVVDDDGSYYYSPQESDGEVKRQFQGGRSATHPAYFQPYHPRIPPKTRPSKREADKNQPSEGATNINPMSKSSSAGGSSKKMMDVSTLLSSSNKMSGQPPAIHLPWSKARIGPMETGDVGREKIEERKEAKKMGNKRGGRDEETAKGGRGEMETWGRSEKGGATNSWMRNAVGGGEGFRPEHRGELPGLSSADRSYGLNGSMVIDGSYFQMSDEASKPPAGKQKLSEALSLISLARRLQGPARVGDIQWSDRKSWDRGEGNSGKIYSSIGEMSVSASVSERDRGAERRKWELGEEDGSSEGWWKRGKKIHDCDSETGSGSRESQSEFSFSEASSITSSVTAEQESDTERDKEEGASDTDGVSESGSRDEEGEDSESGLESEAERTESSRKHSEASVVRSKKRSSANLKRERTSRRQKRSNPSPRSGGRRRLRDLGSLSSSRPKTSSHSRPSHETTGGESEAEGDSGPEENAKSVGSLYPSSRRRTSSQSHVSSGAIDTSDNLSPVMEDVEEEEEEGSEGRGSEHGSRKRRIKLVVDREYETSSTGEDSAAEPQRSRVTSAHNSHANVNGSIYMAQNGSIIRTRRSGNTTGPTHAHTTTNSTLKLTSPIFSSRLAKHFKKLEKMAATLEENVPLNNPRTAGDGGCTLRTFQQPGTATSSFSHIDNNNTMNVFNTRQSSISPGSTSKSNTGPESVEPKSNLLKAAPGGTEQPQITAEGGETREGERESRVDGSNDEDDYGLVMRGPLECPSDRTQSDEEELWMGPWNSLHIPMTKL
ncbi:hypothetical protein Q5P01_023359 [Channa striata]|uniref:Uncharacterized protein n=1 Tax=Channa striata TaxID=64152 RepID=A0AA88LNU2_CHASR|nr:hypothetical protein Q5P01_023359 [Channa striata]